MYNKDIDSVFKELDTSKEGLNEKEVMKRLEKYGENTIKETKQDSSLKRFIKQFKDKMIIILIIVAILLFIYGFFYSHEYTDMIVIIIVVFINAIIGFIEEEKANKTLKSLKKYETYNCKVKRNGQILVVSTSSLVPGDIIILEAGDLVPADARVIKSLNALVDESSLTGESVPVLKNEKVLKGKLLLQDRTNIVYKNTLITSGSLTAVIFSTGMDTEIGKVFSLSLNGQEVKTPLELKIEELSRNITILIFIFIIFIFIISVLKGFTYLETIMLCASLAVAAIPEGLPAVIAITLSGGVKALARKKTVAKSMHAVETLGATDIICSDKTGTITLNQMSIKKETLYNEEMIKYIFSLCNEGLIYESKYVGDPTETCLYSYLKNKKIDPLKLRKKNKRINNIPFTSERKISSTVNLIGNKKYLLSKGSVENLLKRCSYLDKKKITKKDIESIKKLEEDYAKEGLRVLAFAYKEVRTIPNSNLEKMENNLRFAGLVGIIDPPRDSVKKSVEKCKTAGIVPVMITGDSIITARAIAKEVGIIDSDEEAIMGDELDNYSDNELVEVVKKYKVYARVSPLHKERIVKAFQVDNKVVAMTGDGVNDAPAIKDAHVGVGMGISGTDVTKEVSDIILLDDSFSTIVTAVEEGRRIYTNIRNNIVYSMSSNFAEIFIVLVGLLTNNLMLLPIHILFIDLVTDSLPSLALAFEKSEKNIMKKKPRGLKKELFTPFIKSNIVASFIIESIYALITYFVALTYFSSSVAASLALLSIVVGEIVYSLSCRNLKEKVIKQGFLSNKIMNISIVLVIIIELLVFLTPFGKFIKVETISIDVFLITVLFNLTSFFVYEGVKKFLNKYFKD